MEQFYGPRTLLQTKNTFTDFGTLLRTKNTFTDFGTLLQTKNTFTDYGTLLLALEHFYRLWNTFPDCGTLCKSNIYFTVPATTEKDMCYTRTLYQRVIVKLYSWLESLRRFSLERPLGQVSRAEALFLSRVHFLRDPKPWCTQGQSWADANVFASSRPRHESILMTRNGKTVYVISGKRTVRLGSPQGLYERFPIRNLIR